MLPHQRACRFFVMLGLTGALLLLRAIDPVAAAKWLPFHTSCGAVTGLPCLFCGMTRALHMLLTGQFSRAVYFNWLAFPFVVATVLLIALFAIEILCQRQFLHLRSIAPFSSRRLTLCTFAVVALWALHAFLAVSQHKTELLNVRGPLYRYLVKAD